jgi:hypothetical protein
MALDVFRHTVPMRSPLAMVKNRRRSHGNELRPMRWLPTTALVLTAVVGGGLVAVWILNVWADHHSVGLSASEAVNVRLDAIKTALTVAAGLGAGVTLLVALRKQSITERGQHHIERAQQFAEEDAREQRITALYVAAAEQLGSEKAAVRLAGLYALERLGQDNPKLRQTVIDVICAYLRMPYTPPAEIPLANVGGAPQFVTADIPGPDTEAQPARRQELEVRRTAQRLIRNHTKTTADGEPPAYWRSDTSDRMSVDLTRATLVNLDLAGCHLGLALTQAKLYGQADLTEAQFDGIVDLSEAQFYGNVDFIEAQFHKRATLSLDPPTDFDESACLGRGDAL